VTLSVARALPRGEFDERDEPQESPWEVGIEELVFGLAKVAAVGLEF
jgi:hypothetical protein